jgi:hypothetical protein
MKARQILALATVLFLGACDRHATAPAGSALPAAPLLFTGGTGTLLIDTGPGPEDPEAPGSGLFSSQPPGCEPVPDCEWFQFLGGQFTLESPATIASIEGWIRVDVGGRLEVTIRNDVSGDGGFRVPGDLVYAAESFELASPQLWEYRWHTFSGFNVELAPGTYWVTLEPVQAMGFGGAMADGAPHPLPNYAFHSNPNNRWINLEFVERSASFGIRIRGPNEGPSPAERVTELSATVAALGLPHGAANALDATLRAALHALDAGDIAGACDALGAFINQVNAQAGKRIPAGNAATLIEEAASIRALLGC